MKVAFMFFPNYVLGDAMLQISNLESLGFLKLVCEAQRDPTYIETHEAEVRKLSQRKYDAFDWDAVGLHCTVLFVEFVVYVEHNDLFFTSFVCSLFYLLLLFSIILCLLFFC